MKPTALWQPGHQPGSLLAGGTAQIRRHRQAHYRYAQVVPAVSLTAILAVWIAGFETLCGGTSLSEVYPALTCCKARNPDHPGTTLFWTEGRLPLTILGNFRGTNISISTSKLRLMKKALNSTLLMGRGGERFNFFWASAFSSIYKIKKDADGV